MAKSNFQVTFNGKQNEEQRERLKSRLTKLGTSIDFESDTWHFDKVKKSAAYTPKKYKAYFSKIPTQYRDIVKYYVLSDRIQIETLTTRLSMLAKFFVFLEEECGGIPLKDVMPYIVENFKVQMSLIEGTKGWKSTLWAALNKFFKVMAGWEELPDMKPINPYNPWSRNFSDRRIETKYIPKFVTEQLDNAFKNENIPVPYRLMYWLLRSIPSRVSEVASMYIDCIKPYGDNYVIFIPTWKQAGGYLEPQIRIIHIKDEGHGKYLLDLIKEQQEYARSMQEYLSEEEKGYLFVTHTFSFNNRYFKRTGELKYYMQNKDKNNAHIFDVERVARMFASFCAYINLRDEKKMPYILTSHQLRHNGITDRLYAGFSMLEIRDMTGHQGYQMIFNSYLHTQTDLLKEKQDKVNEKKEDNIPKPTVYFRGRILNLDKATEERLLRNPRAYRILDGDRSLGLCSDITSCQSGMFECLGCDYFVPNAEDIDYFREQIGYWQKRVAMFKAGTPARENAEYNLSLHKAIVRRIEITINTNGGNE